MCLGVIIQVQAALTDSRVRFSAVSPGGCADFYESVGDECDTH